MGQSHVRLLVRTNSLSDALKVAERLRAEIPQDVLVKTWRDLNRPLFFALRLEKTLMFIAVFLIIIVAAMALVSDLMLILASKQSEIGMLGAMGASPRRLRKIFLYLGIFLVALGSILGVGIGVASAWTLDRYRVLSLPEQVYFLDYVPFLVRFRDVAWIVGATLVLTLSSALVASRRASTLSPVEALRK
jgi:lipoprotein-releasing system permease protein